MKKMLLITLGLIILSLPLGALIGDTNGDGTVNIVDALEIAQWTVGLCILDNEEDSDVNIDGVVNILDALIVAQYDVGLITKLPANYQYPSPTNEPEFMNLTFTVSRKGNVHSELKADVILENEQPMTVILPGPEESVTYRASYPVGSTVIIRAYKNFNMSAMPHTKIEVNRWSGFDSTDNVQFTTTATGPTSSIVEVTFQMDKDYNIGLLYNYATWSDVL